jgi:hypothetical protein
MNNEVGKRVKQFKEKKDSAAVHSKLYLISCTGYLVKYEGYPVATSFFSVSCVVIFLNFL